MIKLWFYYVFYYYCSKIEEDKIMRPYISFILALLLVACNNPSTLEVSKFTEIESIMEEHPDSALVLLQNMQVPSNTHKKEYATYHLLLTQALDKNFIVPESDSIINLALDYFDKNDQDIPKKALAYYYAGRVNSELHRNVIASNYYLEAVKLAEKMDDKNLLSLIYSNLGYTFLYQDLPEQGLNALKSAYHYSNELNDSIEICYALRDLGRAYDKIEKPDSAIYYHCKGIEIARKINNEQVLSSLLNEIAITFKKEKKFDFALQSILESKAIREKYNFWDNSQVYLTLGDTYSFIRKLDSAYHYLNKALITDNIYTKADAYKVLYHIDKYQKNYQKAIEHNDHYLFLSDSIAKITHRKEMAEIQAQYDQEKLINENNQLILEKRKIQNGSLLALVIILTMIVFIIYFYQKKLLHKERNLQKIKEQIRKASITIKENETLIRKNEEIIQVMSNQLNESRNLEDQISEYALEIEQKNKENISLQDENKGLIEQINSQIKSIRKSDADMDTYNKLVAEKNALTEREEMLTNLLIDNMDIIHKVKTQTIKLVDDELWDKMVASVNKIYNDYTTRLSSEYPLLTSEDLEFCCLIKLRLSTANIAEVSCISAPAVTKRKQRIRDRMGLNKSIPLNSFLWDY